jgi:hypothetical protein
MATVLTLIGLLSVLAILTTRTLIQRARAQATATQMVFMRTGLLNLATSCEGLPRAADSGGDPGLVYRPAGAACWTGPYLAHWPTTTSFGGGTSYRYRTEPGAPAQLSAEALGAGDARTLASQVATRFAGQARLISAHGQWAVAVDIGGVSPR